MKFFRNFVLRYLKFFICGAAAFFIIECGMLYYLNSYYLVDRSEYTVKRLTSGVSSNVSAVDVTIDSSSKHLVISHDGRYLAYLEGGQVKVVDLTSDQDYEIPQEDGMDVATFKWVYDRDRLILAETSTGEDGDYYAKTYYYDMKDRELTEIRDNQSDQSIKIELSSSKDTITQMDLSTETVVTYLKVTNEYLRNKVWEINVMVGDNVSRLTGLMTNNVGKIQCLKSVDDLIYEDEDNGRVYKNGNTTAISAGGTKQLKIIGFDSSDNVYLGKVSGGKVTAVYYGSLEDSNWTEVAVDAPCDSSQLYVTYSGTVFENEASQSTLVNLSTDKRISYEGDFAGIFDKGFITNNNNTIKSYSF